jgi:hypothetical protein
MLLVVLPGNARFSSKVIGPVKSESTSLMAGISSTASTAGNVFIIAMAIVALFIAGDAILVGIGQNCR